MDTGVCSALPRFEEKRFVELTNKVHREDATFWIVDGPVLQGTVVVIRKTCLHSKQMPGSDVLNCRIVIPEL
jgi:hypothetical protein